MTRLALLTWPRCSGILPTAFALTQFPSQAGGLRCACAPVHLQAGMPAQLRDSDEFARLAFAGLEMVPPGAVLVSE